MEFQIILWTSDYGWKRDESHCYSTWSQGLKKNQAEVGLSGAMQLPQISIQHFRPHTQQSLDVFGKCSKT